MKDYKQQLNIIEQSMNDTKYIKDSYYPANGIIKILKYWFLLYTFSILTFFIIDKINIGFELYNYSIFYTVYNLYRIMICCMIPVILVIYIKKMDITVKERRYLKIWVVFPILFCLDNCLGIISSLLNANLMISFYQSFPISSIVNIIFIIYLYSYFKYNGFIALISICILYYGCSFYFLSTYINLLESSIFQTNLFILISNCQSYRIIEILTLLIAIILLNRKCPKVYEK